MLEFQKSHRERLAANIEKKVRSICTSVEKKMIDPFPLYMFYSCEDPARAASFFVFLFFLFLFLFFCNMLTMLVSLTNNKNISLNLKNLKIKTEIYFQKRI